MPARLRFIESYDTHSMYERPDGSEVYLAPGFPRVELFDFTLDWALAEWDRSPIYNGSLFVDWLRDHVINPEDIDDALILCDDCGDPTDREESWTVGRHCDLVVCQSCMDSNYYTCHDCDSTVPSEDINSICDEMVCDSCRDRSYSFCEECDEYYPDDYGCGVDHDPEGCECESPATSFAIRNDGEGMLGNDERVTVSLAAGVIDDEGMWAIRYALQGAGLWSASTVVLSMDARWQTKDGNFTKRLSRAAYKYDGTKIPPAVLSQIGCIARDHSKPVDFSVAVTRELNMSAADFYHADSCWFTAGAYGDSRCALKSNGGFGLRSFGEYDNVSGRAWVMPLRQMTPGGSLTPTFDTETPDAFVVFNGYGALEGYNAARIVSHMAGMTYRKVTFSCSPMYINSDAGYLVAPEDIAEGYTDGSLYLNVDTHSDRYYRESNARETVNV